MLDAELETGSYARVYTGRIPTALGARLPTEHRSRSNRCQNWFRNRGRPSRDGCSVVFEESGSGWLCWFMLMCLMCRMQKSNAGEERPLDRAIF